jgi:hypothetical protein
MKISPYFEIIDEIEIDNLQELFNLNKKKIYGEPGVILDSQSPFLSFDYLINNPMSAISFVSKFETSGIFRGQAENWPLVPSSYRRVSEPIDESQKNSLQAEFISHNYQLEEFCKIANQQVVNFPQSKIEQTIIAQHYGIETPFLDWTTNILVAAYFALGTNGKKGQIKELEPSIYHITDERLLNDNIVEERIELFSGTSLVRPSLIDRRIERQFSLLTFHSLPLNSIKKIPIKRYKIATPLYAELWRLMEGIGFSAFYFFSDYASIAESLKEGRGH